MLDDVNTLYKIASLYYENGNTQDEIAHKVDMSRPMVSRALDKARNIGLVRISVVPPKKFTEPGDLSLVLPKRILDGIIEMIYALDRIAPGTANDDTLLYGVEVKFYNMEVKVDEHLETRHKGLYMIGDGSGVTHSLSHASASGVFVAREILGN